MIIFLRKDLIKSKAHVAPIYNLYILEQEDV